MEVELHSGASFQQVDIHFSVILYNCVSRYKSKLALVNFLYKLCKHLQVTDTDQVAEEKEEDQQSAEDETEVGKIQKLFFALFFFCQNESRRTFPFNSHS